MAHKCPLTAPLVIKDVQGGIVGETGTVWTIAADCNFTVARQIGPNTAAPHKQGSLTAEQRQQLAALLERIKPAALPHRLGGEPRPNAHQITVSYGPSMSVLTLPPPGGDRGARGRADQRQAQILELAHAVREMIGN